MAVSNCPPVEMMAVEGNFSSFKHFSDVEVLELLLNGFSEVGILEMPGLAGVTGSLLGVIKGI